MATAARTLHLRTGDARDVAVVDELMAAAFDPRFGEAWTRSQCLGVLAMPGVQLLIAYDADLPAGFALTRTIMDEAELLLLAVAPSCRRRGVGGALLRAVIADARAAGVTKLHLEVRAGNDAVALYTSAGFARIGERRGYYRGRDGRPHDAHTYLLGL
ncbi:MAG: GNAT family N-acetyltransferase [Sphingomonas sp.]|nr:MAG: GNAT family N-acetyltransferase [Sphingomonas sp.]